MSDTHVSKIRIKMGPIELEYEGSEGFLKEELPDLLSAVSKLYTDTGGTLKLPNAANSTTTSQSPPANLQLTTGTIASRIKCKSGPDLIRAAAGRLYLGIGQVSFTRQQILDQMQDAPTYYKATYSNNLTKYLSNLVKGGKLNEVSKDTYSLTPDALTELRAQVDSQGVAEGPAQQV